MDQISLVTEQIEDGRKLVQRLIQEGIRVSAAWWLKPNPDASWRLYIALPLRDKDATKAYRRVQDQIRQMPQPFWVGLLDARLISPKDRITKRVLEIQQQYPTRDVFHCSDSGLAINGYDAGEAHIYPRHIFTPAGTPSSELKGA
jgi:hypothetical protein